VFRFQDRTVDGIGRAGQQPVDRPAAGKDVYAGLMVEPPRIVVTVGLHSSASTWVFNVVRELMAACLGPENVLAIYAEDVPALLAEQAVHGRHVVLKSHHGGVGWDSLLWLTRAPVFLSVRDPRDATMSLAQRFRVSLADAARGIGQDCRRLQRCADAGHAVLRYEDKFFEDSALPGRIAERLGLAVDAAIQREIFDRYSTASTRTFAANLAGLPPDRLVVTPDVTVDRVTQIHRTHIGDGRIGKWRDLPLQHGTELTQYFAPFLARFGYDP
jgi:hypothetical protein